MTLSIEKDPSLQPFLSDQHQVWDDEAPLKALVETRHLPEQKDNCYPNPILRSPLLFHTVIFLLYTCVFLVLPYSSLNVENNPADFVYSPASSAISYQRKAVDGLATDSIFAGDPSPQLDAAWHDLLANINLRITAEEMKRLNQTSLELADGSGHLGTLGVYHELHCLKRTRKWIYRDYYYPNITDLDRLEHEKHVEHCIELLRQAAICKGDISITGFKWLGNTQEPTTKDGVLHRCVDWDRLSSWARERVVDLFDPELLVRPSH